MVNTVANVYALAYCAGFDFPALQSRFLTSERCVAYRNVLHVQWHQGEVFIFDYGVLVFWHLDAEERNAGQPSPGHNTPGRQRRRGWLRFSR